MRAHEGGIQALKEGWAAELRRQREAWAAAESARRDDWVARRTREIKELTAKVRAGPPTVLSYSLNKVDCPKLSSSDRVDQGDV